MHAVAGLNEVHVEELAFDYILYKARCDKSCITYARTYKLVVLMLRFELDLCLSVRLSVRSVRCLVFS